jgi:hypothetical protein
MGQQQLLLIILGVIVVGIAISVGVAHFIGNNEQSNKDAITADLIGIAADAYHYRVRPISMGGGSQSYIGYLIPTKLAQNENGTYTLGTVGSATVQINGSSSINSAWVASCTVDDTGSTSVSFSGW